MNYVNEDISKVLKSDGELDLEIFFLNKLVEFTTSNSSSKFSQLKPNVNNILRVPRKEAYYFLGLRFSFNKSDSRRFLRNIDRKFDFLSLNKQSLKIDIDEIKKSNGGENSG